MCININTIYHFFHQLNQDGRGPTELTINGMNLIFLKCEEFPALTTLVLTECKS